jgi:hypothetical protein
MSTPLRTRAALVTAGVLAFGGLATPAALAATTPLPTTAEIATGGSDGWQTATESTATVSFVGAPDAPLGTGAARLETGVGDAGSGKGGKAYVFQNDLGDTQLDDLTDLGYSAKVESLNTPSSKLAPSMGLSLMSDDGWQGTLVFEPYYQGQTPSVGSWQDWDADAGVWWFTRDVVDADSTVVFARQSTHTLGEFKAAFDANPTKYGNLRLDPRGGGVQVYAGNSGYMTDWNGFSALVDNVTVGTASSSTTWDLEQGLGSVPVSVDGDVYTVLEDARTFSTINLPDHATIDGAGHTITAVEDDSHRNFQGPVLASAVGDGSGPAELHVQNLKIATDGFRGGSNSGGTLQGISFNRAGGSLTDVAVDGISHGNGVQEGNAISIRNRVAGDNVDVPRARVTLKNVKVSNYQKTGVLLDGNLAFTADHVQVGMGAGPEGQPNPVIAANSLQISRGASGSVTDSSFALNSHAEATGVLLYNAKKVTLDRITVTGDAAAEMGVYVGNFSNTIDTSLVLRDSKIIRTNGTGGVGLYVDDAPVGAVSATVGSSTFSGWDENIHGDVTVEPTPPAVTTVDVKGRATVTRPKARTLKIVLRSNPLREHQVEGKLLRWRIAVDGRTSARIRQHAGDSDAWGQRFKKHTGTHTVKVFKNGTLVRTLKVRTR